MPLNMIYMMKMRKIEINNGFNGASSALTDIADSM